MRDRLRMNIQHQPNLVISPARSSYSLGTPRAGHATNRTSSPLNGPGSIGITSFGVKHSLGVRAGSRLAPAGTWKRHGLCRIAYRGSIAAVFVRNTSSSASVVTTCSARRSVTAAARVGRCASREMNIPSEGGGGPATDTVALPSALPLPARAKATLSSRA